MDYLPLSILLFILVIYSPETFTRYGWCCQPVCSIIIGRISGKSRWWWIGENVNNKRWKGAQLKYMVPQSKPCVEKQQTIIQEFIENLECYKITNIIEERFINVFKYNKVLQVHVYFWNKTLNYLHTVIYMYVYVYIVYIILWIKSLHVQYIKWISYHYSLSLFVELGKRWSHINNLLINIKFLQITCIFYGSIKIHSQACFRIHCVLT